MRRVPRIVLVIAIIILAGVSRTTAQDRRLTRAGQDGGRRLALVVGNDSYAAARLNNARNDARAVSAALKDLGFDVTEALDVRRDSFAGTLAKFSDTVGPNDAALFYYAGHGMQIDGENYLVPVDFKGTTLSEAKLNTVPVSSVQEIIQRAKVSIVVLDACRNNPFSGTRASGGGLAPMEARGSLVAFAAGAGQTASDNASSGNGLFTTHFLSALKQPGLGVREVFRQAREQVVTATNGNQFPAVYDGLVGDFVFRPGSAATSTTSYVPRISRPGVQGTARLRSSELQVAALTDLQQDCDAGNWRACGVASSRYEKGDAGAAANPALAMRLAERACGGGDAWGCSRAAYAYSTGAPGVQPNQALSAQLYEQGCGAGDVRACFNLAIKLRKGEGVPADAARAATLFERACDSGEELAACVSLAYGYSNGLGVSKDEARAAALYEKACKGGESVACFNLGIKLRDGAGVTRNAPQAAAMFRQACDAGHLPACNSLAVAIERGTLAQTGRADASSLFRRACDGGVSVACANLEKRQQK